MTLEATVAPVNLGPVGIGNATQRGLSEVVDSLQILADNVTIRLFAIEDTLFGKDEGSDQPFPQPKDHTPTGLRGRLEAIERRLTETQMAIADIEKQC